MQQVQVQRFPGQGRQDTVHASSVIIVHGADTGRALKEESKDNAQRLVERIKGGN